MAILRAGERVALRCPVEADRTSYQTLREQSRDFHSPWEPLRPTDGDPNEAFDRVLAGAWTERRVGLLATRIGDGAILGAVNLNEIGRGAFQSAYMGYWIGAPHARRGYMTEAVGLGVRYAFEDLGLHRVEANIIPSNVASIALVRRLGFRREGYSPKYLKIAGVWQDHERWALTVEDGLVASPTSETAATRG